jgi:tetratricopeptide (TPR) repeat protein
MKNAKIEGAAASVVENTDLVTRFRPQLLALALVLACLAAHTISFWNGFVLNDHFNIPILRDIAKEQWNQYWTELITNAVIAPFAEPLLKGSIALDFLSGRMHPAAYHATNVLLHVSAVLSAFFLLRRLVRHFDVAQGLKRTGSDVADVADQSRIAANALIPFIACLLFAVHPLTSESVAYISGRSSILTFLFYTFALHCFLTGFVSPAVRAGLLSYLFCYLALFLSIFSSSQAITIPETMVFLGLMIKARSVAWKDWVFERSWEFGLAIFVSAILPLLFLIPQRLPLGNGLGLPLMSPAEYFATQAKELVTYYLRVFILPVPLSFAPPFCLAQPATNPWLDPLAIAGLVVIGLAIFGLYFFRRLPFAAFGLWIFLIGLLPQSLLVSNEFVGGHRFYFSCFGLSLFVTTLALNYFAGKNKVLDARALAQEPALVLSVAAASLVLVGLSNYRDHSFATDSGVLRGALRSNVFDRDVAAQSDRDGHVRALLSLMLALNGGDNIQRGLIEAKRALAINPNLALAYITMARQCLTSRDYDGAKFYSERALKLAAEQKLSTEVTGLADSCLLIAMTELKQFDDPKKLKELAKAAAAVDTANPKIYLALGKVYISEHKPESGAMALVQLAHARRLDINDVNMLEPLALAHLATGESRSMEAAYQIAGTLDQITPCEGSRMLLARAALETGRLAKADDLIRGEINMKFGKITAEQAILLSGIYKQAGQNAESDKMLALARKEEPGIEKRIHLWLRIKPLSTIEQAREKAAEENKTIVEKRRAEKPEAKNPPSTGNR